MRARRVRRGSIAWSSVLLMVTLSCAAFAAAGTAPSASAVAPSIKDSPGYYPPNDPESLSVVVGRRTNAPLVSKPFQGGARSLAALRRTVARLVHHADTDSLLGLCITEDEFRDILWREFPQSRPATGLTWEDGWTVLYARLYAGCRQAVRDHEERPWQFVRFESDSVMRYKNFSLHNGLVMVMLNDAGQLERTRWLRSVAERKGRFKIYSTND
jgi:hypothetical protein